MTPWEAGLDWNWLRASQWLFRNGVTLQRLPPRFILYHTMEAVQGVFQSPNQQSRQTARWSAPRAASTVSAAIRLWWTIQLVLSVRAKTQWDGILPGGITLNGTIISIRMLQRAVSTPSARDAKWNLRAALFFTGRRVPLTLFLRLTFSCRSTAYSLVKKASHYDKRMFLL